MDRETFDRILAEEGLNNEKMRDNLWNRRPSGELDEERLRSAAKKFKRSFPEDCAGEKDSQ